MPFLRARFPCLLTCLWLAASTACSHTPDRVGRFAPAAPLPGTATLYIYRNQMAGVMYPVDVAVDHKRVGAIENDHYVEVQVAPGEHTVFLRGAMNNASLPLTVQSGEQVFIRTEMSGAHPLWFATPRQMVESTGKRHIGEDCTFSRRVKLVDEDQTAPRPGETRI